MIKTMNHLQHYYLQNMGITQWMLRGHKASSIPEVNEQATEWNKLRETVANCVACGLHATRTQTVFGVGNPEADLLIVGEAPGANEDRQGLPFVGRAGQLLDAMLKAIGLQREQIYIANILKCRPPNNRDPKPEEVALCTPFLQRQIALINPKVIMAVGRIAARYLLNTEGSLSSLRGQPYSFGEIPLLVTYHPAYLLRNPRDKGKAYQDLLTVKKLLKK